MGGFIKKVLIAGSIYAYVFLTIYLVIVVAWLDHSLCDISNRGMALIVGLTAFIGTLLIVGTLKDE